MSLRLITYSIMSWWITIELLASRIMALKLPCLVRRAKWLKMFTPLPLLHLRQVHHAFSPKPCLYAHSVSQVLVGIAPFLNKSDELTMYSVDVGFKLDWPSNNPSQRLLDELRGPIELCWSKASEERPTMLEVQHALKPEEGMSWFYCCNLQFNQSTLRQ